jgi:Mor family transcriptional regulator
VNELAWIAGFSEEEIRAELPADVLEFVDLIGLDGTLALHERFGGMTIYVKKLDKILRAVRDKRIRAEFAGANYATLARQYRLSESYVRAIVAGESEYQQESMFE